MDPREGIMLALQQIRAQKLKSFFAVLGVIIGVMFLITVVMMRVAERRIVIVTFDADVAHELWIVRDYLPEQALYDALRPA